MNHLETILEELYALDPSLRQQETHLRQTISALLAARPAAAIDEQFVAELRARLQAAPDLAPSPPRSLFSFHPMQKLMYIAAGSVLATILIVPSLLLWQQASPSIGSSVSPPPAGTMSRGDHAFGSLTALSAAPGGNPAGSNFRDQSGGGGVAERSAASLASPTIVRPDFISGFRFVYRGEPVALEPANRTVYRRVKGLGPTSGLASAGAGLIDLNTFPSLRVQSLNLTQATADGYTVFVDYQEGTASISRTVTSIAETGSQPLAPSDVPSDGDLIAIASAFLRGHGVAISGYGAPVVVKEDVARIMLDSAPGAVAYVPEFATVVYPQTVDGTAMVDEGGNPHGVNVNINLRTRQVNGVWNLTTLQYESSSYAAETDFAQILKALEARSFIPEGTDATISEVILGAPAVVYLKFWRYHDGASDEIALPALSFPVTQRAADQPYWGKAVVVPLITELLDSGAVMPGNPGVMPLPAVEVKPQAR